MRVAQGLVQDGVVVGNSYDKYGTTNPVARALMRGFMRSFDELVARTDPLTVHEVGCGEGHLAIHVARQGKRVTGSDFSSEVIALARENVATAGVDATFHAESIYNLTPAEHSADLVVCCEVMEHLEDPDAALEVLRSISTRWLIASVPREPLWRVLNMTRGKYLRDFGNTPGHLQHWSRAGFVSWLGRAFAVREVRTPLPWTMVLAEAC